jgi:hypothetical protein
MLNASVSQLAVPHILVFTDNYDVFDSSFGAKIESPQILPSASHKIPNTLIRKLVIL